MTREEVKLLKVGDIVWIMCRDEEPGTAAKCRVTKEADEDDIVEVKCVDRADCKGHRLWRGDVRKSEVEAYENEIGRASSTIRGNNDTIRNCRAENKKKRSNLKVLTARLEKAREEAEKPAWVVLGDCAVRISANDGMYDNYIKYETKQEAYDAIADYYKNKFIEASLKGTGGWLAIAKERIVFLPRTWSPVSPKATFDRMGADMNGQVWRFKKSDLCRFRKEAEESLKEKEGEAYAKAERRQV